MLGAQWLFVEIRIIRCKRIGQLQRLNRLKNLSMRIEGEFPFLRRIPADLFKILCAGFAYQPPAVRIGIQLIGIGATWVWAFVLTAAILFALKYTIGIRVSEEDEEAGLDISEHAETAYRLT